jgi:hypothetical protein
MNSRLLAALAILPFVTIGCAGRGSPTTRSAAADAVVIPLRATSINAGNVGQATLLPLNGDTSIVLDFTGVPGGTTLPVHVYTYLYEAGCGALPTKAAYALNDRVLAVKNTGGWAGPFKLAHMTPLPMNELLSGRFSIALRSAPQDGNQVIFCGEVRRV